MDRPNWDTYFMGLAFMVSLRSLDPRTKHGTIIVDPKSHKILSTGYNGPPQGVDDAKMPTEAPEKYLIYGHSENSAISLAARTGTRIDGATLYVTGHPCPNCLIQIVNAGIAEVIYGPVTSKCIDEKGLSAIDTLMKDSPVKLTRWVYTDNVYKLKDDLKELFLKGVAQLNKYFV